MFFDSFRSQFGRRGGAVLVGLALSAVAILPASSVAADHEEAQFPLVVANNTLLPCLAKDPTDLRHPPTAEVNVERGDLNDTLKLKLKNIKPGLAFDLFTIQRSNKLFDGSPDPNFKGSFGMAWYQSDIEIGKHGASRTQIRTILLDQIFGFDADVKLNPVNTFHLGFWFNNPDDAQPCSATPIAPTPFNGEHKAGPFAMISATDLRTQLGPLCTDPSSDSPSRCDP
jgi:hypothetical protein